MAEFTCKAPRSKSWTGFRRRRDEQWERMTDSGTGQGDPHGAPADTLGNDLAELVRRSEHGDEAAFAALYDATSSKVYGLAVRVTRSPELAAEVVQEVYLMAWEQAARFTPSRGTVLGWLCTMAHRRAVDRVRQVVRERDREQTYENRRTASPSDHTWQEVEQTMDVQEVRAGLSTLTPLQREAVNLSPLGNCDFSLPALNLWFRFRQEGGGTTCRADLWNVVFEPDHNRFCLSWGCTFPIGKRPAALREIEIRAAGETAVLGPAAG